MKPFELCRWCPGSHKGFKLAVVSRRAALVAIHRQLPHFLVCFICSSKDITLIQHYYPEPDPEDVNGDVGLG